MPRRPHSRRSAPAPAAQSKTPASRSASAPGRSGSRPPRRRPQQHAGPSSRQPDGWSRKPTKNTPLGRVLSQSLSRACLGKMIAFGMKCSNKRLRFSDREEGNKGRHEEDVDGRLRKTAFLSRLYLKTMILPRQLGTNTGKALKKRCRFSHRAEHQERRFKRTRRLRTTSSR